MKINQNLEKQNNEKHVLLVYTKSPGIAKRIFDPEYCSHTIIRQWQMRKLINIAHKVN